MMDDRGGRRVVIRSGGVTYLGDGYVLGYRSHWTAKLVLPWLRRSGRLLYENDETFTARATPFTEQERAHLHFVKERLERAAPRFDVSARE